MKLGAWLHHYLCPRRNISENFVVTHVHYARNFGSSAHAWRVRTVKVEAGKRAKAQGFRSRAAAKLLDLQQRFEILRAGQVGPNLAAARGLRFGSIVVVSIVRTSCVFSKSSFRLWSTWAQVLVRESMLLGQWTMPHAQFCERRQLDSGCLQYS